MIYKIHPSTRITISNLTNTQFHLKIPQIIRVNYRNRGFVLGYFKGLHWSWYLKFLVFQFNQFLFVKFFSILRFSFSLLFPSISSSPLPFCLLFNLIFLPHPYFCYISVIIVVLSKILTTRPSFFKWQIFYLRSSRSTQTFPANSLHNQTSIRMLALYGV